MYKMYTRACCSDADTNICKICGDKMCNKCYYYLTIICLDCKTKCCAVCQQGTEFCKVCLTKDVKCLHCDVVFNRKLDYHYLTFSKEGNGAATCRSCITPINSCV